MSSVRLVMHVGMQQSGAGVLHRALNRIRLQLRNVGVAYVGNDAISKLHAPGWLANGDSGDTAARTRFESGLAQLAEQELSFVKKRRRAPVVLLSSDSFIGGANLGAAADTPQFRPYAAAAVQQVAQAIGVSDTTVVLYTRRQDRLMELCYAREVLNGSRHSFEEQFPNVTDGYLDYVDLIDRITAVPDVHDIVVRPYEMFAGNPAALAGHLLGVAGVGRSVDLRRARSLQTRPTCSARGLEIALRMNEHLETSEERVRAKEFVLAQFPARDDLDARFLGEQARARILSAHGRANAELFTRFMRPLPATSYAADEQLAELQGLARIAPRRSVPGAVRQRVRSARRAAAGLGRRVRT